MTLIKNRLPILEYDSSSLEVIKPNHENLDIKLPKKAAFLFLGDTVDSYALTSNAKKIAEFISITKVFPIYEIDYKNEKICIVAAPAGASASVQLLDWLIGYGVETVIAIGSCGALVDIPENTFIIPTRALRDEGTSYHYLPAERYVTIDENVVKSIENTFSSKNIPYIECMTWTTDGFFRETMELVEYRREEGCAVVEMECSALAACAKFRNIRFGEVFYTADTLANTELYDERDWGKKSLNKALMLCLDIIIDIK